MRCVKFSKTQFRKIWNEAKKLAKLNGREVCGLILDNGSFFELIQTRNKAKRGGGFSFYFGEVRAIRKLSCLRGREIVGTFHSHPVGLPDPGPSDLRHAVDDSLMLIFDVTGRTARLWRVKRESAKRLQFSLI